MVLGHHGRLPLAIIAVGLAIAAADGPENLRADFRHFRAGAGHVDDGALSGLFLTEQSGVALDAGKAAALLADADRMGAGRD